MQQRGKALLPLRPTTRQHPASLAGLLTSHRLCFPQLTASQPENRQPLPWLPRESCFGRPEDVTLQGRGHGRSVSDLPQPCRTPSRCEVWRGLSCPEGWSHPRSTQPVDPDSAASLLGSNCSCHRPQDAAATAHAGHQVPQRMLWTRQVTDLEDVSADHLTPQSQVSGMG